MRVYRVGGAVRDQLLMLKPRDNDYVVVGSTPEEMIEQGFKPVGEAFPVFLHPETREEYALARTEKKHGSRHQDFLFHASPDVTLEEDLMRRDFTINAMAMDIDSGALIDPHNGRRDISQRLLRHVSPSFGEDPLRILRAARYASSLGFAIVKETSELLRRMVADGELRHLPPERIWSEFSRGLSGMGAVRFVCILRDLGALAEILPELEELFGIPQDPRQHPEGDAGTHTLLVLHAAVCNWWPLPVRLACLLHDIGKTQTPKGDLPRHPGHEKASAILAKSVCERLRIPKKIARQVIVAAREHGNVHGFTELDARERAEFFGRIGAWQGRENIDCLLAVADCDNSAHPKRSRFNLHPAQEELLGCLEAALDADTAAAGARDDPAESVLAARAEKIKAYLAGRQRQ